MAELKGINKSQFKLLSDLNRSINMLLNGLLSLKALVLNISISIQSTLIEKTQTFYKFKLFNYPILKAV
jgi:hypothetical protein